jgi:hypothetical protein
MQKGQGQEQGQGKEPVLCTRFRTRFPSPDSDPFPVPQFSPNRQPLTPNRYPAGRPSTRGSGTSSLREMKPDPLFRPRGEVVPRSGLRRTSGDAGPYLRERGSRAVGGWRLAVRSKRLPVRSIQHSTQHSVLRTPTLYSALCTQSGQLCIRPPPSRPLNAICLGWIGEWDGPEREPSRCAPASASSRPSSPCPAC